MKVAAEAQLTAVTLRGVIRNCTLGTGTQNSEDAAEHLTFYVLRSFPLKKILPQKITVKPTPLRIL